MSDKIYAIASDIHGSSVWCEKFLNAAEYFGAEKLLLLGDLLYHGPRNDLPDGYDTKKVVAMLSAVKEKAICVRGNCDSEVDQMVLSFPVLADYALFPYEHGGKVRNLFLTHGHLFNAEKSPALNDGDVLFNGHFHVPCHKILSSATGEESENKRVAYYLNCGSVSLPKENSPHSFVLLKNGTFTWIDLATGKPFDEFTL